MSDYDPLTFERLAALTYSGLPSSEAALDKLSELVISLCEGLLDQKGLTIEQIEGLKRTKSRVPDTFKAYRRWISLFGWPEEQRENALFLLATMADNILSLGALAMRDERTAAMALKISIGGQKGGKKGGKTRKGKAENDAAIVAIEARRIRIEHPNWSQDDLASDIIAGWKTEHAPGHTKVKGIISALEKAGDLPKRRSVKSVNEGGSTS